MRWKQHCSWNCHADFRCQRVVEKFFIGTPPKRIVYDCGAAECRVLEPGAIERHILRDPIDHHVVPAWLALDDFVYPDEFGDDVLAAGFLIHPLDKRRRETVFLSKKNSYFFHMQTNRGSRGPRGSRLI